MSRQGGGRLGGRVCVVTGATGIAAAAARRFAAEGAAVFVIADEPDQCDALRAELGGDAATAVADLRDEAATEAAFAECHTQFGALDALFAVAGASGRSVGDGPVHDVSLAAWDATLALNATPAFLAAREAVRAMREPSADGRSGGAIVLTTSVLATDPAPTWFATHAYAAAKAAIVGLTRAMAAYYASDGIRVNALAPGLVDTPMAARAAADPAVRAFAAAKQPLAGGLLGADDLAGTAAWLCSDDARHVTGQVITVDGGWTVRGETR